MIIAINYFGVGVFGEFEFWFSSAKVLILLGLIIFTLCVAAGVGNVDHPTGFHYWSDPGAFAVYKDRMFDDAPFQVLANITTDNHPAAGRFLGFWNVLRKFSCFSFAFLIPLEPHSFDATLVVLCSHISIQKTY